MAVRAVLVDPFNGSGETDAGGTTAGAIDDSQQLALDRGGLDFTEIGQFLNGGLPGGPSIADSDRSFRQQTDQRGREYVGADPVDFARRQRPVGTEWHFEVIQAIQHQAANRGAESAL